jgi:hypothetical protein
VSADTFDAHFDRFSSTAARLETLPAYDVGGEEARRIAAWRARQPRPERSVRTSPWLARIAVTTATGGKTWTRVRIVDDPLTDYQRYQLQSYVEGQAAGERILLARRSAVADVGPDVWLFDAATDHAFALVMRYDAAGRWLGFEHLTEPATVAGLARRLAAVELRAMPLNVFLAQVPGG